MWRPPPTVRSPLDTKAVSWSVADGLITVCVNVTARGGRLPAYAGNVEIINAAAVLLAERHATARNE